MEQQNVAVRMNRRVKERRVFVKTPPFPIMTVHGRIMDDRRRFPDRRLNSIQVMALDYIINSIDNHI
jgi:hypothetical protein